MSLTDCSPFLTEEILSESFKKAGGEKLITWSFCSDIKKGDSYQSNMCRIKLCGVDSSGESMDVNVLIKLMLKDDARKQLLHTVDFFRNEINFYTKVIPAFEAFQLSKYSALLFTEYPKCYASHCDGVNDFIILEDLSIFGFKPPSRLETVDVNYFKLVMKSMARFHAVSLAFKDQQPEEFAKVANSLEEMYYTAKNKEWYSPFLKEAIEATINAVEKEFPGTIYEEKTKKFLNHELYDTLCHLVSYRNRYSVIGHGDCWMPNFLVQYDDNGIPIKTKLIDFQLARYGSLALDVSDFMYVCVSQETKEKYLEEILKEYYKSACKVMMKLGSDPLKIFPYAALKSEIKDFGKFGCGMAIEMLLISMMGYDDVKDLNEISNPLLTDVLKFDSNLNKEQR